MNFISPDPLDGLSVNAPSANNRLLQPSTARRLSTPAVYQVPGIGAATAAVTSSVTPDAPETVELHHFVDQV